MANISGQDELVTKQELAAFYQAILPYLGGSSSGSGSGGTSDYTDLENKPSINNVELTGNKTLSDLGLKSVSTTGSYNDLTNKPKINNVELTSNKTLSDIGVNEMTEADINEIITPLPSNTVKRIKYSTEEQIIGEWVDGKPIYQKTFSFGPLTKVSTYTIKSLAMGVSVDNFIRFEGIIKGKSDPFRLPIPYIVDSGYCIVAAGYSNPKNTIDVHYNGDFAWVADVVVTAYYTKV